MRGIERQLALVDEAQVGAADLELGPDDVERAINAQLKTMKKDAVDWRPLFADVKVRKPKKKICGFCKDKATYVDYKDTALLRKFISDRGKIRARRVTGNCVQHQRDVATAIKNAREVALLPYTSTAR